jgi:hypothetical protein
LEDIILKMLMGEGKVYIILDTLDELKIRA